MKTLSLLAVVTSGALFAVTPRDAESAVWVSNVTITDTEGTGCNTTKTSSVATVPASRYAHSLTFDWVHHITVSGVIGGIHEGSEAAENTNALNHSDTYSNNPGTNIIVYAEAQFSMEYCGAGGQLIEVISPTKMAQQPC